jgi:hypothetical protein
VSLYIPRRDRKFYIQPSASYVAAAAIVSQYDDDGHLRLVAAVSRSFIKSERTLAPVQKEILALIYTLTSLHYILKGASITVFADAKSICLLKTCATSSPYLSRLAMELSQYTFDLHHIEGRINLEPDALSRLHKTQEFFLAEDKTHNDSMTKEESLLFLEFLKIPVGERFTVSEVKHFISSEPLRSQLQKKIKSKYISNTKTEQDNSPTPMKSKKTKEPRYVRRHPLEAQVHALLTPEPVPEFHMPIHPSYVRSPSYIPTIPDYAFYESDVSSSDYDTDTDSELEYSSDDQALNSFLTDTRRPSSPSIFVNPIDPSSDDLELAISELLNLPINIPCTTSSCLLHDSDVTNDTSFLDQQPAFSLSCSPPSIIAPFHSDFDDISTVSSLYALNNAVGTHNIELNESLQDLAIKSKVVNTGVITPKDFAEAQKLDTTIVDIREKLTPKMRSFTVQDDILYKIVKGTPLPFLPKSLENFLLNCMHFHVLAGHRSSDTIIAELNKKYFIPELVRKVKAFCRQCYICSIAKSQRMLKTIQGQTLQAMYPKHVMSFDIFGALEPDADSNAYVYSFMDNFSLFVINIKAKTKSAVELTSAFLQVFAIWSSVPEIVVTDNESGLMTKETLDFFASLNIQHNPGASYASWRLLSEGASIRKSKEFMRSVLKSDPASNWPSALDFGTIALNNTKTIHGYSPVEMFFGTKHSQNPLLETVTQCPTIDEYLDLLKLRYDQLITKVNASRKNSNKKRTDLINRYRRSKQFEKGQLVWLKALAITPQRAVKERNKGPFKILHVINPHTFKLASLSNPNKCERISHASHLEPYRNSIDITPINFPMINIAPKNV